MLLVLLGHLYLSDMWRCEPPKMDTKKTCFVKILDYVLKYDNHYILMSHDQHKLGESTWPFDEHENFHFDNDQDIFIWAPNIYEESACSLDFC